MILPIIYTNYKLEKLNNSQRLKLKMPFQMLCLGNYITYGRDYVLWYERHLTITHSSPNTVKDDPQAGN